jgi:hypothetical protein
LAGVKNKTQPVKMPIMMPTKNKIVPNESYMAIKSNSFEKLKIVWLDS